MFTGIRSKSVKGMALKAALFILILGLMLTGCSAGGDKDSGDGGTAIKEPEVLKLGAFYPLTGANTAKGQLNKNGTELAAKDTNDAGGLLGMQVQIVYEDTQSKKEFVPNVVRKLIEQDQVIALIGEVASSNSIAAAPVLKELKRPAIAPTSTNPMVVMDPRQSPRPSPEAPAPRRVRRGYEPSGARRAYRVH